MSIEGKWIGTGYGFQILKGLEFKHDKIKIELDIRKELNDIYLVQELYRNFQGSVNFLQGNFLIIRDGNDFYCEDSSGFGTNRFTFSSSKKDPNNLDTLKFKYTVANDPVYGNVAAVYTLKKTKCP